MNNPKIQVKFLNLTLEKILLEFLDYSFEFISRSKNLNEFSNYVIQISFGKKFIRISDSFKLKFIQFLIQRIMSFKFSWKKIYPIFS